MKRHLEQKLRSLIFGEPSKVLGSGSSPEGALLLSLNLFHQQYRTLFLLYLGLLLALSSLVIVVSYLIFSTFEILMAPAWLVYALSGIDLLLLAILGKGLAGWIRFRQKNQQMLSQAMTQVIHKLGLDHGIPRLTTSSAPLMPHQEQDKWDSKPCPSCHQWTDLLEEVCPHCLHPLGALLQN